MICVRHPHEVSESLTERDGSAPGTGPVLWLRYLLDAEAETRRSRRCIVTYEGLLRDWPGTVAKIGRTLSVTFPLDVKAAAPAIEAFLNGDLRHHRRRPIDLESDESTSGWVDEAYAALLSLSRSHSNRPATDALDRISASSRRRRMCWGRRHFLSSQPVMLSLLQRRTTEMWSLSGQRRPRQLS